MPWVKLGVGENNWMSPAATLNNVAPVFLLRPYEFHTMSNFKWDGGLVTKRGGTVLQGVATSAAKVMGLWIGYRADGTETPVRLRLEGGLLEYSTSGTWTTTTSSGWGTTLWPSIAVYQSKFYICNGSKTPVSIPLATPATLGTWGTLPTSFNPSWVVAYGNRLYSGGDTSTPNRVHFSDFGDGETWQEQNFYAFPDDQQGGFPIGAVPVGKGIILSAQDFLGFLTGYSELDHEIQPTPRRAAILSRRCIIDMGGSQVYMTSEGPEIADGFSQPRSLDPNRAIDWGSANLIDPNDLWGMRSGPFTFRIYFRNRGAGTATDSATLSVGRLFRTVVNRVAVAFLNRVVYASTPAVSSHYYEYDMVAQSWSGPHTGAHSSGTWETMMHGDRQFPWLGDSANGKVYKGDQDVYTDDTVNIKCVLRTGSFGIDPFKAVKVKTVQVICNTSTPNSVCKMRVYMDEQPSVYKVERVGKVDKLGPYFDTQSTSDQLAVDRGEYCVLTFPLQDADVVGRSPQVEIVEESNRAFTVRAIALEYDEVK